MSLCTQRNPSWHLATTRRRTCAHYRNSLSSSAVSPRELCSGACARAGISKLSRSRFAKSATRKEQRKTTHVRTLRARGRRANRASGKRWCHLIPDRIWIWNPLRCGSRIPDVQVIWSRPPGSETSHFMRVERADVNY